MRITILSQGIDGGIARVSADLAAMLAENSHCMQVIFIGPRTGGDFSKGLDAKGVLWNLESSGTGPLRRTVHALRSNPRIIASVVKFAPDIILCAGVLSALFYGLALRRAVGVPVVEPGFRSKIAGLGAEGGARRDRWGKEPRDRRARER